MVSPCGAPGPLFLDRDVVNSGRECGSNSSASEGKGRDKSRILLQKLELTNKGRVAEGPFAEERTGAKGDWTVWKCADWRKGWVRDT